MTFQERALYHQIHPLKLLADWLPSLISIYLLWRHKLVASLLLTFVPTFASSAWLISTADLTRYKNSAAGRYIKVYMTPQMQLVRMAGQVIIWGRPGITKVNSSG